MSFEKVDSIEDSHGKGYVSLYSGWNGNSSEDSRIEMVTKIASLSYGREEAKNPEKLYNRLKSLKHDSLFEFINPPVEKWRIVASLRHDKNLPFCSPDAHKEYIATFRIKTPIFVVRQFMRHRGFSYLEMSRRYVDAKKVPLEFWFPNMDEQGVQHFEEHFKEWYDYLLRSGIPPEEARAVLPTGLYTEFYCQAEVKILKNFFNLRLKKDAQKQIREVAENMLKLIEKHQPELYKKL
jgi:hypothetical protein